MLLQFFGGVPMVYPDLFFRFFPRNFKLNLFNLTICKLKSLVNLGSPSGCRRFCSCSIVEEYISTGWCIQISWFCEVE